MMNPATSNTTMREAIDAFDWGSTSIGSREAWPLSLRTILDLVLNTSFPMLVMWGPELVQIYNAAYVPIFGDKHPTALGQAAEPCWADIWSDVGPLLTGVYDRGEPVYFENLPLRMERGGHHEDAFFTFSYSPIREEGAVAGIICVVSETTAHVLRERETEERATALAALDRAKTEFFQNISHEFRTPLTLILGPLEELVRTLPDYESRQKADLARRNAIRLHKLVNSLLDVSVLESGLAKPKLEPFDIDRVTADLVSEFRAAFEAAGLRLSFSGGVAALVGLDTVMYEKIVLNLLSNALKFTPDGCVDVETQQDGDVVSLTIRDTGIGISEADRAHLFKRFSRIEDARSRTHEGSGIGLALVSELVALHGGRIDVASEVGRGTSFKITFPMRVTARKSTTTPSDTRLLREGFRVEAAAFAGSANLATGSETLDTMPLLLIADDNADLRSYLESLLNRQYRVLVANDGFELLAKAREHHPDLIVADVMMPRMDGFQALEQIRNDDAINTTPVILLSARAGEHASAAALARGADDYVVKPFVASDLMGRIDALLRRSMTFQTELTDATTHASLLMQIADRFIVAPDLAEVWSSITAVLTPAFADWSVVYVPDANGHFEAMSIAHRELAKAELGAMIEREYPYRKDDGSALASIFKSGESLLVPNIVSTMKGLIETDRARSAILRALNLRSAILVPIAVAGSVVAIIGVVRAEREAPFDSTSQHFLERFAQRCASAFVNASTREHERSIATTLQRALLPSALPSVDGLQFSAAYTPAERETMVGGDWYDAIALPNGEIFLSIGDVVGHGLEAATVMGNLRQAARGLAVQGHRPSSILAALNSLLLADHTDRLSTAYVAVIDSRTLAGEAASAGHLLASVYAPALPTKSVCQESCLA